MVTKGIPQSRKSFAACRASFLFLNHFDDALRLPRLRLNNKHFLSYDPTFAAELPAGLVGPTGRRTRPPGFCLRAILSRVKRCRTACSVRFNRSPIIVTLFPASTICRSCCSSSGSHGRFALCPAGLIHHRKPNKLGGPRKFDGTPNMLDAPTGPLRMVLFNLVQRITSVCTLLYLIELRGG
jgi:hypothetical protein